MPERDLTNLTAVEMLVVSASKCFATTLELEAYKADIPLNEVTITFIGKFAKAPFLSLREGNSGLHEPHIELTVVSSVEQDRKSTRLNSSHVAISYAVFCLKKKDA